MIRKLLVVTLVLFYASSAWAEEETKSEDDSAFHPSRVRLLLHGSLNFAETLQLRAHFIPAPNLRGDITPLLYLGLGWQVWEHLNLEPVVGYATGSENPIFSLRLSPKIWRLRGWADIEIQVPSLNGYWFANLDFKIYNWLLVGIEGEGWGQYGDAKSWSHGFGPNILLRFGILGLDLALHIRDKEHVTKPEFFIRVHLFAPSVNF